MRGKSPSHASIQKARRYLNWWDSRFSKRFFSLRSGVSGEWVCVCARRFYECVLVHVCALLTWNAVWVQSPDRARALLTLPSSYLQVLLCHARAWGERKREIGPNIPISASPARARVEPECLWKTECCWTCRRTCVRHEKRRPRNTASSGKSGGRSRSALLPERAD